MYSMVHVRSKDSETDVSNGIRARLRGRVSGWLYIVGGGCVRVLIRGDDDDLFY